MRHGRRNNKLGRVKSHREAMLANMASSLMLNEYIVTTEAKAKQCKLLVDKVISRSKKGKLSSRRRVEQLLRDKLATDKVINVLAGRFKDVSGGYVSIMKLGNRSGDNARMAKLVLVGSEPVRTTKKLRVRGKKKAKVVRKTKSTLEETRKKKGFLGRVKRLRGKLGDKKQSFEARKGFKKGEQPSKLMPKSRSGI